MDFIYEYENSMDSDFCDELIKFFNNDPDKMDGMIGNNVVDKTIKNSKEIIIDVESDPQKYGYIFKKLHNQLVIDINKLCENEVIKKYACDKNILIDSFKIQKTSAGDVCYKPHVDNTNSSYENLFRNLTFIYYLNDVEEGGETHFTSQNKTVKAKKGKVIFFPPYWTHEHEGLTPLSGDKYIAVGWVKKKPLN